MAKKKEKFHHQHDDHLVAHFRASSHNFSFSCTYEQYVYRNVVCTDTDSQRIKAKVLRLYRKYILFYSILLFLLFCCFFFHQLSITVSFLCLPSISIVYKRFSYNSAFLEEKRRFFCFSFLIILILLVFWMVFDKTLVICLLS